MGGNAFRDRSDFVISRVQNARYNTIGNLITRTLKLRGNFTIMGYSYVIPVQTHGDIDIMVSTGECGPIPIFEENLKKWFGALVKAVVTNGEVTSIAFHDRDVNQIYQVDLIRVDATMIEYNRHWRGHKGIPFLGAMMLRQLGIKTTGNGFFYPVIDNGQNVGDVNISKSMDAMDNFLDIRHSTSKFIYGFSSLDHGYQHLVKSPLFCLDAFYLNADLEYTGPAKYLEFPRFVEFVEWIKTYLIPKRLRGHSSQHIPQHLPEGLKDNLVLIVEALPGYQAGKKLFLEDLAWKKAIKERFNGDVVMAATGLTPGPELGLFMEGFKREISSKRDFSTSILGWSPETLQERLKAYFEGSVWAWVITDYESKKNATPLSALVEEVLEPRPAPAPSLTPNLTSILKALEETPSQLSSSDMEYTDLGQRVIASRRLSIGEVVISNGGHQEQRVLFDDRELTVVPGTASYVHNYWGAPPRLQNNQPTLAWNNGVVPRVNVTLPRAAAPVRMGYMPEPVQTEVTLSEYVARGDAVHLNQAGSSAWQTAIGGRLQAIMGEDITTEANYATGDSDDTDIELEDIPPSAPPLQRPNALSRPPTLQRRVESPAVTSTVMPPLTVTRPGSLTRAEAPNVEPEAPQPLGFIVPPLSIRHL